MKRIYESVIEYHISHYEQMAFLPGPRQVGKTTLEKQAHVLTPHYKYFNWDIVHEREQILAGSQAIVSGLPLHLMKSQKPIVAFDEIHKFKNWRNFLKGFYDEYKDEVNILVTGSAKLNVLRRAGDSLMGRYFLYRVHPLSVAEIMRTALPEKIISMPMSIDDDQFDALYEFGGFPAPFLKQEKRFYNQWQQLRQEQLIREDIRDLAQIHELAQLEVLAVILREQAGQLTDYQSLSKKIQVSDQTIRRWIKVLESFFYCFTIKPWAKNVTRSLLKQPKLYLWDWSLIEDKGGRIENFVASHLLKAVHFWTDLGFGKYELYFLRDKEKREVDFLVTQNGSPWLMVEVKSSAKEPMSASLLHFQSQLNVPHVLQVAFDMPYIEKDCFSLKKPMIVPLKTFLSQLI